MADASQHPQHTEVTGQGGLDYGPPGADFEYPMDSAYWGNLPPAQYDIGGGQVGGLFDDGFGGGMALKPDPA